MEASNTTTKKGRRKKSPKGGAAKGAASKKSAAEKSVAVKRPESGPPPERGPGGASAVLGVQSREVALSTRGGRDVRSLEAPGGEYGDELGEGTASVETAADLDEIPMKMATKEGGTREVCPHCGGVDRKWRGYRNRGRAEVFTCGRCLRYYWAWRPGKGPDEKQA